MAASFGNIPMASVRRLISALMGSNGFGKLLAQLVSDNAPLCMRGISGQFYAAQAASAKTSQKLGPERLGLTGTNS